MRLGGKEEEKRTDRLHDLELVLKTGRLRLKFTFLRFRGIGGRRGSDGSGSESGSISGFIGRSDLD